MPPPEDLALAAVLSELLTHMLESLQLICAFLKSAAGLRLCPAKARLHGDVFKFGVSSSSQKPSQRS